MDFEKKAEAAYITMEKHLAARQLNSGLFWHQVAEDVREAYRAIVRAILTAPDAAPDAVIPLHPKDPLRYSPDKPILTIAIWPDGDARVHHNTEVVCSAEREAWLWRRIAACMNTVGHNIHQAELQKAAAMEEAATAPKH